MHNLKLFVAAGLPIDHPDVHIYRQSYISAHSELTWILDCFTGVGEMNRMTQFKDKSAKLSDDRISVGLFNYPVLMAADILLYNSEYIPVGDDQSQHIEFARDIAERFNSQFGEIFTVPKPVKEQHEFFGKDQGLRIKDLSDPSKKMSKSNDSDKGVIFLSDEPEVAAQKVASATTDSLGKIKFDEASQPGISNLLQMLALLENKSVKEVEEQYQGQDQYGPFKAKVAESLQAFLGEFQSAFNQVDENVIKAKLASSETALAETANATLLRAQKAVGLR